MFKTILSKIINIVFGLSLNYLLKLLNFVVIFRVGNAIGDHVYMSNIIREINIKTKKKFYFLQIIMSFFLIIKSL